MLQRHYDRRNDTAQLLDAHPQVNPHRVFRILRRGERHSAQQWLKLDDSLSQSANDHGLMTSPLFRVHLASLEQRRLSGTADWLQVGLDVQPEGGSAENNPVPQRRQQTQAATAVAVVDDSVLVDGYDDLVADLI